MCHNALMPGIYTVALERIKIEDIPYHIILLNLIAYHDFTLKFCGCKFCYILDITVCYLNLLVLIIPRSADGDILSINY